MDKQEIIDFIKGMNRRKALQMYTKLRIKNITRKEFKEIVFENTTRINPFKNMIKRVPIPKHIGKTRIYKEYAIFLKEQKERIRNDN